MLHGSSNVNTVNEIQSEAIQIKSIMEYFSLVPLVFGQILGNILQNEMWSNIFFDELAF